MHELVTEHTLVSRSTEFESAIRNGEKASLRELCEKKSEESKYVFISLKSLVACRRCFHACPIIYYNFQQLLHKMLQYK